MEILVEEFKNGKVVLICPGKDGSVDGFGDKYKLLAEKIVNKKLAAVVRISNPNTINTDREINLRNAIEYIQKNSTDISGSEQIELTIIGVSAGGRSAALLSSKYIEIKNILLVEPAKPFDDEKMKDTLSKFVGNTGIIVGSGSDSLGIEVGEAYKRMIGEKGEAILTEVENCDHHFSDPKNSELLENWIMDRLKSWL